MAVQPAEAIQKTRLPGGNSSSSIETSSYTRPKRIFFGPEAWSNRPAFQGVSALDEGTLSRGDPGEYDEREVLHQHTAGILNVLASPQQAAGVHAH